MELLNPLSCLIEIRALGVWDADIRPVQGLSNMGVSGFRTRGIELKLPALFVYAVGLNPKLYTQTSRPRLFVLA